MICKPTYLSKRLNTLIDTCQRSDKKKKTHTTERDDKNRFCYVHNSCHQKIIIYYRMKNQEVIKHKNYNLKY